MEMHREIFAAIVARDPDAAGKAMFIHTSGGPLRDVAEQRFASQMPPIDILGVALPRDKTRR